MVSFSWHPSRNSVENVKSMRAVIGDEGGFSGGFEKGQQFSQWSFVKSW